MNPQATLATAGEAPFPADLQGAATSAEPAASSWDRPAVTLRLTTERKRALLALLPDRSASEGPTAALDLAMRLALDAARAETAPPSPHGELLAEMAGLAHGVRGAAEGLRAVRSDLATALASLSAVAADVAALRSAISSAALGGEPPAAKEAEDAAISIKAWLDRSAGPPCSWLVANARLQSQLPAGRGWTTWILEARIVGGDGLSISEATPPTLVALGPAPGDGSASRVGERRAVILDCRRSGGGWSVAARAVDDEGNLGVELARVDAQ